MPGDPRRHGRRRGGAWGVVGLGPNGALTYVCPAGATRGVGERLELRGGTYFKVGTFEELAHHLGLAATHPTRSFHHEHRRHRSHRPPGSPRRGTAAGEGCGPP